MTTTLKRLKDRRVQRLWAMILGGKMAGLAGVWGLMMLVTHLVSTPAGATALQNAPKAQEIVSPVNTIWVLVTAFLVFFMQAGFMALEAGFARSRETVNVLLECVFDTCLCGLLYWAFGFAFQFGAGNGFIGHQYFFLHGIPLTYGSTGVAFLAFFLF